jgi:isochorismate synthase EntC
VSRESRWRLFAGAGIVRGSTTEAEWEETLIKFEPVIRALDAVAAGGWIPGGAAGRE